MASKRELKALITLAGKVDPSLRKALQTAAKDTQGVSGKLKTLAAGTGKAMKAIGKTMAVAGTAIVSAGSLIIGTGVQWASDLEEVQNVVDTTFGESASAIDEWAKTATKAFGLSELQAKQYSGTMGAMLKSTGIAGDKMLEMSKNLTGLAGDIASFYNLDHDTAWQKIRAGIAGETEPLKQLGINMSVANLEAFAMTKGINASWNEMDQASQAMVRYAYLMETTKDAQGDFTKTQGSFSNQMRLIKTNFQQVVANAAKTMLPTLAGYLQMANQFMESGGLTSILGVFSNMLPPLLEVAKGVLPVFTKLIDKIGSTLAPVLVDVLSMLVGDVLVPMAPLIGEIVTQLLPPLVGLFSMLFNDLIKPIMPVLIELIRGLLPLVAAALKIVFAVLKPILPIITMLIQSLLPPLLALIEPLVPLLEAIAPYIAVVADAVGTSLANAIQFVMPLINTAANILSVWMGVLAEVLNFIRNVFTGNWEAAWQNIVNIFNKVFKGYKELFVGILNFIIRGINKLFSIKMPDWIPGIGGQQFGLNIPEIQTYAKGGFASRPSIFGEDGLEAAIPIKYGDARSLSLLNQTARYIGAEPFVFGRSIESVPLLYEKPRSISQPVSTQNIANEEKGRQGITIVYSPNISGGEPEKVERILREDKERLRELIEEIFEDEGRVSFA